MKKTKLFGLILSIAVLILELLPFGAVLNFAADDGETFRRTYSYFSLTPYGYANFGPFITAVLSLVLLILFTFAVIKKDTRRLWGTICIISSISVLTSLLPLITSGINGTSVVGLFISLILICILVIGGYGFKNFT